VMGCCVPLIALVLGEEGGVVAAAAEGEGKQAGKGNAHEFSCGESRRAL